MKPVISILSFKFLLTDDWPFKFFRTDDWPGSDRIKSDRVYFFLVCDDDSSLGPVVVSMDLHQAAAHMTGPLHQHARTFNVPQSV